MAFFNYKDLLIDQYRQDIKFLSKRSCNSGTISFSRKRDFGCSSNSIVAITYRLEKLSRQTLPGDKSDLDACERMWKKLPSHRKTDEAKQAMKNARNFIKKNKS